MTWEICPECYEGLHQHWIGQGCYCDCQLREQINSEKDRIFDDEAEDSDQVPTKGTE